MRLTHLTVAYATIFFVIGIAIGMAAHTISGATTATNTLSVQVNEIPEPKIPQGSRTPFIPEVIEGPAAEEEAPIIETPTVISPRETAIHQPSVGLPSIEIGITTVPLSPRRLIDSLGDVERFREATSEIPHQAFSDGEPSILNRARDAVHRPARTKRLRLRS